MNQLTLFAPEPHASHSVSPDSARDWMTRVATSCLPLVPLLQSIGPVGWSGRTSPASFQARTDATLQAFWDSSRASKSPPPPKAGRTAAPSQASTAHTVSRGASLTLSLCEWNLTLAPSRSGDAVCSLSDILETGELPPRYFLSAKACRGILRRAEKRGKLETLPAALRLALEAVAGSAPTSRQRGGLQGVCEPRPTPAIGRTRTTTSLPDVCGALSDGAHQGGGLMDRTLTQDGLSRTLNAGAMGRQDWETETLVIEGSHANGGGQVAVAFERRMVRTTGGQPSVEINPCLRADENSGDGAPCVATRMRVRRLTPRECERLQGFPDDFTLVPYPVNPAKDGPRYKAIGNSMAVNVMSWIGQRIDMVDKIMKEQRL